MLCQVGIQTRMHMNQKIMQHMNGNIPYRFDCWADPVVHLLLLKSSMCNLFFH